MFARVIPLIRTPLGVEEFDYKIPEGMAIQAGDLVRVPFRKQPTPALVKAILTDSPFAERALPLLDMYADIRFPSSLIALLEWTAERTFSSRPSVLKSWLRNLPKRTEPHPASPSQGEGSGEGLREVWLAEPESAMLRRVKECLAQGERVLLLTPWLTRIKRYQAALSGSAVLHNALNDGDAFRAWTSFLSGQTPCLVTTRLGAWLAPCADRMILDEPENDDYKQDELAPRYDARLVAAWCAEHAGTSMETFGLTNPLGTDALIPTISLPLHIHVRHPQGRSVIPMIQADTLNLMREHTGPLVVIHPIRGMSARLVCRDCGWQAVCAHCGFGLSAEADHAICRQCGKKSDMPIACASCGGTDLGKSLPGIEKLKTAWKKHEPNLSIEWRNLTNETMDASLPANAMIVVTDGSLLGGVTEDVRRRERQCIAFRRLASRAASAHGSLIIQSDESMIALWNQWLSGEGVQRFHAEELKQRKAFRYPPAVRLVKILIDETETVAKTWLERAQKTFGNDAEYHGPFPVPYRPTSRKQRFVCHLIFDRQINERDLIARLKPLAASVIMDLDPIAFFK